MESLNEFISFFQQRGESAEEILKNFLVWFLIPNILITFLATQIIKKILIFLRKKYGLGWISGGLYPLLGVLCGIIVVGTSFLLYAQSTSLWLIVTFGVLVGLVAVGFFDNFETLLIKRRFFRQFWYTIWQSLGLEILIPESDLDLRRKEEKMKKRSKKEGEKKKSDQTTR